MSGCSCNYDAEPARVWRETRPIARKPHKCGECGRVIRPDERYERVYLITSDGCPDTYKTCVYCLAMRDLIDSRSRCFCWLHLDLREFIREHLAETWRDTPGLAFAVGRIEIERRNDK